MTTNDPDLRTRAVEELPSIRGKLGWTLVWFGVLVAVRVAVVPLAGALGLDASNEYLLVKPVAYLSDGALLAVGLVAFLRFVFQHTLGRDMGTRFNMAWADLDDPFKILMVYLGFGAPILIALALLLGLN